MLSTARLVGCLFGLIVWMPHAFAQDTETTPEPEPEPEIITAKEAPLPEETPKEPAESQSKLLIYETGGLLETGIVLGAKLGGGFGQLTSNFGSAYVAELELGYTLPFDAPTPRALQVGLSIAYTGPTTEETVTTQDARLPGDGSWSYTLTQQQLILTPHILYRIPLDLDWMRPYAALGPRIYLSRTEIEGEAGGQPFGNQEETATDYGGFGALGVDFFPGGPGAVLCELQFGYAPVDGFILRNANVGSLNVTVGYRLFL